MKKILIAAVLIAWAGTLYGTYTWGSNKGPSESTIAAATTAENCSMSRQLFADANNALDNRASMFNHPAAKSMPLRVWGREHPDTPLGREALFQTNIQIIALETLGEHCTSED